MAVEIRSIPTLYGEDAERFLKAADIAEKNEHKQDISETVLLVKKFLREQGFLEWMLRKLADNLLKNRSVGVGFLTILGVFSTLRPYL